jgi:hypothetical protein
MKTMTNNLLKNLIAVTVIFCTVGVDGTWAQSKYTYYLTTDGCKIGNIFHNFEKGIGEEFIWNGDCSNGYATGKGILVRNAGNKNMEKYTGNFYLGFMNGFGIMEDLKNKIRYEGDFVKGIVTGKGNIKFDNGDEYYGEVKNGRFDGLGIFKSINGKKLEGRWKDNYLIKNEIVNLENLGNNIEANDEKVSRNNNELNLYEQERQQLVEERRHLEEESNVREQARESERQQIVSERRKLEEEKRSRAQAKNSQRINLQISNTQPNANGEFTVSIKTNSDTASLKINGDEQGGKEDGVYQIKRIARAGQVTQLIVFAEDVYGNTDTKTISVNRKITQSNQVRYAELNPAQIKSQPSKDAVAIIIGIADYKNLPRADYANDDARAFYDYAVRGLGVRAENIKLLVDAEADEIEILRTFKTWLPARVKATTDVYVYYSGHGLPTDDGTGLYLLPQRADRDFLSDTALQQERINQALQATKPKSVTIFLDSCYSGMARTGQTLLASARPITLKASAQTFPADFTVISASSSEQISSSSNELKHGIFSYYLMRGMEGDADSNKDGKITAGEMHSYLLENVARQASLANRVQQPQLAGDANRVLVGR